MNISVDHFVCKMPDFYEMSLELDLLIGGSWYPRRVAMTSEMLAFARKGEAVMIDKVPLAEVENIGLMSNIDDEEIDLSKFANTIMITTIPDGHNSGRTYYLQAVSPPVCSNFFQHVTKCCKKAKFRAQASTAILKTQLRVRQIFESHTFQIASAALILLNFFVCIVDAQFQRVLMKNGERTRLGDVDNLLNQVFSAVFTLELAINIFANWFYRFIRNGWNLLDMVIVLTSLVDMGVSNIPDWLVRLMRAFRVIRLFGRVKQLKVMIAAVSASVVAMANSFVILVVVICIFSILGVSLFGEEATDDFGRFNRAFITMFKVSTGDSWPSSVSILDEGGSIDITASVFFCSYVIIVCWVLLAVCVAVLLDNFVQATSRMEKEEREGRIEEGRKLNNIFKSPLEPLVAKVARAYHDDDDLTSRLRTLFEVLDGNRTGSLTQEEFCVSFKKLEFRPPIYVTEADFASLTKQGQLCDDEGRLRFEDFERMMRDQILKYTLTLLSTRPSLHTESQEAFARLGTVKLIINEQIRQAETLNRIESLCLAAAKSFESGNSSDSDDGHAELAKPSTIAGKSFTFECPHQSFRGGLWAAANRRKSSLLTSRVASVHQGTASAFHAAKKLGKGKTAAQVNFVDERGEKSPNPSQRSSPASQHTRPALGGRAGIQECTATCTAKDCSSASSDFEQQKSKRGHDLFEGSQTCDSAETRRCEDICDGRNVDKPMVIVQLETASETHKATCCNSTSELHIYPSSTSPPNALPPSSNECVSLLDDSSRPAFTAAAVAEQYASQINGGASVRRRRGRQPTHSTMQASGISRESPMSQFPACFSSACVGWSASTANHHERILPPMKTTHKPKSSGSVLGLPRRQHIPCISVQDVPESWRGQSSARPPLEGPSRDAPAPPPSRDSAKCRVGRPVHKWNLLPESYPTIGLPPREYPPLLHAVREYANPMASAAPATDVNKQSKSPPRTWNDLHTENAGGRPVGMTWPVPLLDLKEGRMSAPTAAGPAGTSLEVLSALLDQPDLSQAALRQPSMLAAWRFSGAGGEPAGPVNARLRRRLWAAAATAATRGADIVHVRRAAESASQQLSVGSGSGASSLTGENIVRGACGGGLARYPNDLWELGGRGRAKFGGLEMGGGVLTMGDNGVIVADLTAARRGHDW